MNVRNILERWVPCAMIAASGSMRHDGWHEIASAAVFAVGYLILDILFFDPPFYNGKAKS